MKSVKQILIEARALIALPEHWTQEACARDAEGNSLASGFNSGAVCWCSIGALEAITGCDYYMQINTVPKRFLNDATGDDSGIAGFNDTHTHAEVLAAFDRAIEAAE